MTRRTPDYPSGSAEDWARVDRYFADLFVGEDDILESVLANNAAAGLPPHDVSATQGKFLAMLVAITSARRVLEIGTLGAYSTIWMARALPAGGELVTIEADEIAARIARENLQAAGVAAQVDLQAGKALDVLPALDGPFDLVFIDADKPNNPAYLDWAIRLARPGTIIIGDNVVRGGAVTDPHSDDERVMGVRQYLQDLGDNPKLETTALQTAGEKGWDGFSITRVLEI